MKVFLDTYALIELIAENKKYRKYAQSDGVTLVGNLAELYFIVARDSGMEAADMIFAKMSELVVDMPLELIPTAMIFRKDNIKKRYSYFDALGYIFALNNNLIFLTGDRAFKGLKGVRIVR